MARAVPPSSLSPAAAAARVAWLLCSLALLTASASALTSEDFYPFGAVNGDTTMPKCNDCVSQLVPLPSAVPVFGDASVRGVFVNSNGLVHFKQAVTVRYPEEFPSFGAYRSMVAGFWNILDNTCPDCGNITYRTVNDTAVLDGISGDVREAFPAEQLAVGFSATSAVIVTFNETARAQLAIVDDTGPGRETFQIIVAFNTNTTFIFLLYADVHPQTTYPSYDAQAGFNVGDGVRYYSLNGALTSAVGTATRKGSNIGQPGVWCFGLSATQTIGALAYAGPYTQPACRTLRLRAFGGIDSCGRQRTLNWDLDNDGAFDDAVGEDKPVFTRTARPAMFDIRVQAVSPSPCPGSDALVLNTTVTMTGNATLAISGIYINTQVGSDVEAYVGEYIEPNVIVDASLYCRPRTVTLNCGPDNVAQGRAFCLYSRPGVKRITATVRQDNLVATAETVITVYTLAVGTYQTDNPCGDYTLQAGVAPDACGVERIPKWDFDGDGAFDDASGYSVTFNNRDGRLAPGVHRIGVQASSSPSCAAASPPEVRNATINITVTPPFFFNVQASTSSGGPNATIGESIRISAAKIVQACLPFTETIDCGPDSVGDSGTGVCRYNSVGVKVITVTLEQFGFVVSRSISIIVVESFLGGPYLADLCSSSLLHAAASVDACGLERTLAWDLDNDGVFDDAYGFNPSFRPYSMGLSPGVYAISVRASSSCPDSPPEVVASTTVNVTTPLLIISNMAITPASKNAVASVAERIRVVVQTTAATCAPKFFAIDCGQDSVGNEAGYCRYSRPGLKTITASVGQFNTVASISRTITVSSFYMGGPYVIAPCNSIQLAAPVIVDACGHVRVLAWDFDDDGAFDDATGRSPILYTFLVPLAPGVHPVRVQSSSSPACPTSPTEVHTVNVTVSVGPELAVRGIEVHDFNSGSRVFSPGDKLEVSVDASVINCLPYNITIDCGADNPLDDTTRIDDNSRICRFKSLGQNVITAYVTQLGVTISRSTNITVVPYYIGGPYRVSLCGADFVEAGGGIDECGNTRRLDWDFNDDGVFDDAVGSSVYFDVGLPPGVHPISVRASSRDLASCPDAVPVVLTTNVTVIGSITPTMRFTSVIIRPASGNPGAAIQEPIQVDIAYKRVFCLPVNLTIDCGPDHVGNNTGYCQYGTSGVKLITVSLTQGSVELSRSLRVTVTATAPACFTAAFPEGRVRGRQGCAAIGWSSVLDCNYPNTIKPYTELYNAFALLPSDTRLIRQYFGNRTIAQALLSTSRPVDNFAREAAAALLNAETIYYAQ